MAYYAKPNFIKYDEWFDENIEPLDLNYYFEEKQYIDTAHEKFYGCLLYTSPSPRDSRVSRMPSSA